MTDFETIRDIIIDAWGGPLDIILEDEDILVAPEGTGGPLPGGSGYPIQVNVSEGKMTIHDYNGWDGQVTIPMHDPNLKGQLRDILKNWFLCRL